MRVVSVLLGAVSVWGACNQCPFPTLNITGFLPCLKPVIGEDCCVTGRPLVNNPCVKIWLTNPMLAPFVKIIDKARVACKVDQLAACVPSVAQACPTECGVPSTLTSSTTLAGTLAASAAASSAAPSTSTTTVTVATTTTTAAGAAAPTPAPACGANETYTTCSSSSCFEPRCENGTLITPGPACAADCRRGCKCAEGYARNSSSANCVATSACKPASSATPCQSRASFEKAACGGRMGCASTLCNADGSFAPEQCRSSTGYCWCVDRNGEEVANTRRGPEEERANCAALSQNVPVVGATTISSCNCPPMECAPGWTKKLLLGTEGNCCKGNYHCVEEPVAEAQQTQEEPLIVTAVLPGKGKNAKGGKRAKNAKKAKAPMAV